MTVATTPLLLIRHGTTAWNAARRIQGRHDLGLSAAGRTQVAGWRLPEAFAGFDWVTSPLKRARETASLLGAPDSLAVEPRLMEMDWGAWEGRTLAALRHTLGEPMAANEARGLDFRPEGGESPRDVQRRARFWLAERARAARPTVAITHKGVIRAIFALACGWDMTGKPPARLTWSAAHLFALAADGAPAVTRLNLGLEAGP